MYALTFWQPWATCIAHHGKRVENRTWAPPKWIIGEEIAIHAVKTVDQEAINLLVLGNETMPSIPLNPEEIPRGAVVAIAIIVGWTMKSNSPWFSGPKGWIFDSVRPLHEPISCRGAQSLWPLPFDVEQQIRAQFR